MSFDITRYQLISFDITRYHSTSPNIIPYHSVSVDIARYHSISLNISRYQSISVDIIGYHSIWIDINRHHSISPHITRYRSTSLYESPRKPQGISKSKLVFSEPGAPGATGQGKQRKNSMTNNHFIVKTRPTYGTCRKISHKRSPKGPWTLWGQKWSICKQSLKRKQPKKNYFFFRGDIEKNRSTI